MITRIASCWDSGTQRTRPAFGSAGFSLFLETTLILFPLKPNISKSKVGSFNLSDITSGKNFFSYIEKYLSPYLFGYRKGHNTEQCLIIMIETWKKALDENNVAEGILTNLSKAFTLLLFVVFQRFFRTAG